MDDVAVNVIECNNPQNEVWAINIQIQQRGGLGVDDKERSVKDIRKVLQCVKDVYEPQGLMGKIGDFCGDEFFPLVPDSTSVTH